jgi:hypothetical protein
MNIKDTNAGRDLEALRAAIAGQVFVPGQAGYDQARQAWNLAVDERPSVVVAAGSAPTWSRRSSTPAPTGCGSPRKAPATARAARTA